MVATARRADAGVPVDIHEAASLIRKRDRVTWDDAQRVAASEFPELYREWTSEENKQMLGTERINVRYMPFYWAARPPYPARMGISASGSAYDTFLLMAFHLLLHAPIERLLTCPECDRVFFRVGRGVYCSRRCANRVNQRIWRQTQNGTMANRKNAKKQKVRRRHGARVVDLDAARAAEPWSVARKKGKKK